MLVLLIRRGVHLALWVSLLFALSFCYGDHETVEVMGFVECSDCDQKNIKTSQASSGLHVTIGCKSTNGGLKKRGAGDVDKNGKYKVSLPGAIIQAGELKEECFAQLHSASGAPCPVLNYQRASKLIIKSIDKGKLTLGLDGKLKFSPATCTSLFLWPFFKYPPLPKLPPLPGIPIEYPKYPRPPPEVPPPAPVYAISPPQPAPVYKEPLPPPTPTYKNLTPPRTNKLPPPPLAPQHKKTVPSPPITNQKPPSPTPIYNSPLSPHVPVHKKPFSPGTPTYGPSPPVKKLSPPLPLAPNAPPIYRKTYPPIPRAPPIPKLPPTPGVPRKYFNQPKVGRKPPSPHPSFHA
ncbi:unnamed protein product [Ilex paraguariensis]|uniref:Proline-rich protein n=1 Tax=Ilex paraguariensis TaxID=185542 RepID=A0ABC8SZB6_9AQUA